MCVINQGILDVMLHAVQHAFGANQPEALSFEYNNWFDLI